MVLLNELFKDSVFDSTLFGLFLDSRRLGVASSLLLRLLLVGAQEFVSLLIVDIMLSFVEAQSDECLVKLLSQLNISSRVGMLCGGQSTSMLNIEERVFHTFLT